MTNSKVLIMIPTFEAARFIKRSLDSCLAQTNSAEIWVVDNCSTDKTQSIVNDYAKKYSNIKLFINEKNLGRTGNWNRCLDLFEKSKFDYIKYVFAGDEIMPQCIEEIEQAFKNDKNIGAVVFPYLFVRENGKVSRDTARKGDKLFSVKEIAWINMYEGGLLGAIICDTYNKKFIQGYRFNETFMGKSDFDFAILSRSKAYYLDKVLARFNVDAHMTLNSSRSYMFETEATYNRAFWLEKLKENFTSSEYDQAKEKIMIDSILGSSNYFKLSSFINLIYRLGLKLLEKYYIGALSQFKNLLLSSR